MHPSGGSLAELPRRKPAVHGLEEMLDAEPPPVLPLAGKVATTHRHSHLLGRGQRCPLTQTPVDLAPLPSELQEALTLPRPPIPPHPHHPSTQGLPPPGGQGRERPRGQEGKALPALTSPEAIEGTRRSPWTIKHHQMQAPLAKKEGGGRGKGPRCSRVTGSRTTKASSSPGQVRGCFRFLPGQAGGPGAAIQEAGEGGGLAWPWPGRSRKSRAFPAGGGLAGGPGWLRVGTGLLCA